MNLVWIIIPLLFFGIVGMSDSFAEKTISVQKTVDTDKDSLISIITSLDKYSAIFPEHVKSSQLIGDNVANMRIGFEWLTTSVDVLAEESNDEVTLEIISGDLKGTKIYVTMSENNSFDDMTDVIVEMNLQMSWYMEMLTAFVSDDDFESMLHSSLNTMSDHAENPPISEKAAKEKEQFCIFGFCF